MDNESLVPRSLAFRAWVARVESLVRSRLDFAMGDLPPLPLDLGFDRGDTPTEFLFSVVLPLASWRKNALREGAEAVIR